VTRGIAVTLSVVAAALPVKGGTGQQRALFRNLLHRLGPTRIVSARLSERNPNGKGVTVSLRFRKPETMHDNWDGELLAEAFVERSIDLHLPAVAWYEDAGEGTALGYVDGRPPRPPSMSAKTIAGLPGYVRRLVAARGAALDNLRILRLYRAAIVMDIRVQHPARFLRTRTGPLLEDLGFSRNTFDGVFLSIRDRKGRLVYAAATTNIGGVGSAQENGPFGKYKSCFSLGFPGAIEVHPRPKPPPCPG